MPEPMFIGIWQKMVYLIIISFLKKNYDKKVLTKPITIM